MVEVHLRQVINASTPMLYDVEIMEQFYGTDDDDTGNDTYTFAVSFKRLLMLVARIQLTLATKQEKM